MKGFLVSVFKVDASIIANIVVAFQPSIFPQKVLTGWNYSLIQLVLVDTTDNFSLDL